jgi:hypothetical protein
MPYKLKATNEQIIESYKRLGSVWLVAKELGMCGQSVHERIIKLGFIDEDKWTQEQLDFLRASYNGKEGKPVNLKEIAAKLKRHKTNVSRKARELGLTDYKRTKSDEVKAALSKSTKLWIQQRGHPGGYRELRMCIGCGKIMELRHSATNKCCSRSCSYKTTRTGENIFSRCKHGKRLDLDNKFFRSRYEANYARYLNYLIENNRDNVISWQYEPEKFAFKDNGYGIKAYTPDFKVFFSDSHYEYHEVKGWDYPKGIRARELFCKYYPKLTLVLISEDFFNRLHKEGIEKIITGWEVYKPKPYISKVNLPQAVG